MKIVVNRCYGGFKLSNKAFERLIELGFPHISEDQKENEDFDSEELKILIFDEQTTFGSKYMILENSYEEEDLRIHPFVIQVVEELGKEAYGSVTKLVIEQIPDDVKEVHLDDDNGYEKVYDWDTGERIA